MNNIHDISEVDSLSSLSITKRMKLPPDTLNTVKMPSALWGPFIMSQVQLMVLVLNAKFTAQWLPGCTLNLSAPVGGLNFWFLYVLAYFLFYVLSLCVLFIIIFYKVVGGGQARRHMWRSEDNVLKSFLFFHLLMGSGKWTQVTRLAQQAPLSTKPHHQPLLYILIGTNGPTP